MSGTDGRYNSGMGENNNGAGRANQSQVWDCSGGWYDEIKQFTFMANYINIYGDFPGDY